MNRTTTNLVNQTAAQPVAFVVLQDSWVQLAPYGDFPHGENLQRVDVLAAETLTANFHSFSGKLGRRFAGVPFYIGHPDAPGYENSSRDQKAYGWVMALEPRHDGLYGQVKWSKAGSDLISNAHYKFLSPYWEAAPAGNAEGRQIFRPRRLLSVGLTNQPNLPVLPLANTDAPDRGSAHPLLASLGLPDEASRDELIRALKAPAPGLMPRLAALQTDHLETNKTSTPEESMNQTTLQNSIDTIAGQFRAEQQLAANERARFRELEARFDTLNQRFLNSLIDGAITGGKILPTEREHWLAQLQNDFEAKSAELANAKPSLKTQFDGRVGQRMTASAKIAAEASERTDALQRLVNERMRAEGVNYQTAWLAVKKANPELFAMMHQPVNKFAEE